LLVHARAPGMGHSTLCNWSSLEPTPIRHNALSASRLLPFGTLCPC